MRRSTALALAAASCVAAVACGDSRPLAPADTGVRTVSAPADAGVDLGPPFVTITLRRGQTLWDVAREYGVTVRELRAFNELSAYAAKHLRAGQTIRVPGVEAPIEAMAEADEDAAVEGAEADGGVAGADADATDADAGTEAGEAAPAESGRHTLAAGETLWDVARSYDLTLDAVLRANQWDDDDARGLVAGTEVLIPGVPQSRIREARPERTRTARWGLHHEMARGETIWTLAQRYHVSTAEIMAANGLSPEEAGNLARGRSVLIPGVLASPEASQPSRPLTPLQERALRFARRLGIGTRTVAQQLLHGHVSPKLIAAVGGRSKPFPGTLRWPVANGRFSRGYGSGEGGYHLAVDIMGEIGWNVRAAAPGIVAYAGDQLTGFGNVVIVVHAGGWVTLYGHNSVNFVVAGQRVRAGAILAEVGSTGRSTGPHVHFELIYDGQNCNPQALFRPGIRHRSGMSRISQATWVRPDERPSQVQCAPRRRHPSHDQPGNE